MTRWLFFVEASPEITASGLNHDTVPCIVEPDIIYLAPEPGLLSIADVLVDSLPQVPRFSSKTCVAPIDELLTKECPRLIGGLRFEVVHS